MSQTVNVYQRVSRCRPSEIPEILLRSFWDALTRLLRISLTLMKGVTRTKPAKWNLERSGKIWKDLVPAHGKTRLKRVLKTIAKISICPDLLSICSATGWPSNTRLLQFPMEPWHPSPYLFKICLTKWIKWTTVQSSGCKSYEQKHYTIFTWKGHTFCVTYSASCWIFGVLYIIARR